MTPHRPAPAINTPSKPVAEPKGPVTGGPVSSIHPTGRKTSHDRGLKPVSESDPFFENFEFVSRNQLFMIWYQIVNFSVGKRKYKRGAKVEMQTSIWTYF